MLSCMLIGSENIIISIKELNRYIYVILVENYGINLLFSSIWISTNKVAHHLSFPVVNPKMETSVTKIFRFNSLVNWVLIAMKVAITEVYEAVLEVIIVILFLQFLF